MRPLPTPAPSRLLAPLGLAVLATLLAPGANAQAVLEVGPTRPFADVNAALASASDGDTVLVDPGAYPIFQIVGRGVTIVARDLGPGQGGVFVQGTIRVLDSAPGQTVTLSGISAGGAGGDGLVLANCQGAVRVLDGSFGGGDGDNEFFGPSYHPDAWSACRVIGCDDVAFTGCSFAGGHGPTMYDEDVTYPPGNGGHGLQVSQSTVVLADSTAVGGSGGWCDDTSNSSGGRGGSGVDVQGGWVQVSGCTLVGADGGGGCDSNGWFETGGDGGAGGDGVTARSGSHVVWLDNAVDPGVGGPPGWGVDLSWGVDGEDLDAYLSTSDVLAGSARRFEVNRLAVEGDAVEYRYFGQPGDAVWLALSTTAGHQFQPAWNGALLLGSPWISQRRPMGTLGASGATTYFIPAPQAAALGSTTWHLQALFVEAGGLYLSPVRVLVSLDGGI